MNIMTKRGSEDNIVTYEHYCDTKTDLANIPQDQISLGSVAIVLQDDNGGMGIYLANSNKEWISFSTSEGSSSGGSSSNSGPVIEWIQLAKPEDVFTHNNPYQHVLSLDASSFGWENGLNLKNEMNTWFFVKRQYNGETKYNSTLANFNGSDGSYTFYAATNNATYEQVMLQLQYDEDPSTGYQIQSLELSISRLPSDITSGISIYVGKVTSWNE